MSNRDSAHKICLVIPCYNVVHALDDILAQLKLEPVDVVMVDDGSTDATGEIVLTHKVKVIKNNRNLGKGASLRRGFEYALNQGYEAIITIDGDGQHLPSDIGVFLKIESVRPDVDMIIGSRMKHARGMPLVRRLTNRVMSGLISLICGQSIPDTQNGFRLIRSRCLSKLKLSSNKFEIESEVIIKAASAGAKIISIPITSVYKNNSSKINPLLDTLRFIKFIFPYIGFVVKPCNATVLSAHQTRALRISGNYL